MPRLKGAVLGLHKSDSVNLSAFVHTLLGEYHTKAGQG